MDKIDFVVTWVDGNDKAWQKEKAKYTGEKRGNGANRYREWDLMRYWFRGVEKYAPWVNKVYFVTWGHVPDWLDTTNPKLVIVKHEDYIPKEYLPVFNPAPLELWFHKIKGLSEQFVYFNDDFFLIDKVKETDYFKKGLPCDNFIETALMSNGKQDHFSNWILNSMNIANGMFNKRETYKKNFTKIFSFKNGLKNIRTFLLLPWPYFSEFYNTHTAQAFLKSSYEAVWKENKDLLLDASKLKFRTSASIAQYCFRFYQLASGKFMPRRINFSHYYSLEPESVNQIAKAIVKKKYKVICLNDEIEEKDFKDAQKTLKEAFEKNLPDKCSFEK